MCIRLTTCEEGTKALLDIFEVVVIINIWGLIIRTEIDNMVNLLCRNDISVDVANELPIREYGRNKRDQTSKYIIPKNGAYFTHHDWYKNHKVGNKVEVPFHLYG